MSHHFDTPTGREDPRLNLCDLYLFEGPPGKTVMAMTVNPAATPGTAAPFRDEGLYVFRFDTDGDAREDASFKVRFGQVAHRHDENDHMQSLEVRRAIGQDAGHGAEGELLAEGRTSAVIASDRGVQVFAGVTADPFAGDASALESFEAALAVGKYMPEAFENHSDFFHPRHVAVIVVQVPTELIGTGLVHGWATVSLHGHAPDVQVARWGLPLITHLFIREPEMREDYNRSAPSGDNDRFASHIAAVIGETTRLAGSAADPAAYARRAVDKLGVMTLPYQLGTPASFDYAGFNGRGLDDDVMDVMLSLATNSALGDGVAPDPARTGGEFPYFRAA